MNSSYTVADIRTAMARYQFPAPEFLRRLNRVSEYYLKSDVFTDLFSTVETTTDTGYITIPRRWGRVYGVQKGDLAQPVRAGFYEFVEFGIGRQSPDQMCLSGLEAMGDHFVTQRDLWTGGVQASGTLRLKMTVAADAGKVFRFSGTYVDPADSIEKRVIDAGGADGLNLTSLNLIANTTQVYKVIDGIQAPAGLVGMWSLWKVVAGVETMLGLYYPDERRPRYMRYKTAQTTDTIRMYCRQQHVLYLNDTDFVSPDNLNAIDFGFSALTYQDKPNYVAAKEAWMEGKRVLKEEWASKVPYPRVQLTSDMGGNRASGALGGAMGGSWG